VSPGAETAKGTKVRVKIRMDLKKCMTTVCMGEVRGDREIVCLGDAVETVQ
jgi:hypothetical protein